MNAIVVVDQNWAIGREGDLLFSLPTDMKRFRSLTLGGTVILGRKTLDSFPGGKPLPGRRNIVITRNPDFAREGVEVAHSVEEALALVAGEDPERVWSIGGGEIYRALLPHCRRCCLTRVYARPECDVFFPDLDARENWKVFRSEPVLAEGELSYQFVDYINTAL